MEASTQVLGARRSERRLRAAHAGPAAGLVWVWLLLSALAVTVGLSPVGWAVGVMSGSVLSSALASGISRYRVDRLGLADWVTLLRATLAVGVAALAAESLAQRVSLTLLVSLATVSLTLDAVDGWVARRTRTTAGLGARFDGEVDAFLILVLSVYVAFSHDLVWVLAIGAARYAFLLAAWPLPWMRASLPPRHWRKTVAAAEGIVLTIAAAGILPTAVTLTLLIGALILLSESFGHDVRWLRTHRGPGQAPPSSVTTRPRGRRGMRATIAAALTGVSVLVVWAALVAPSHPEDLTVTAFLRVPLEGLVLVAVAVFLPRRARRLTAGILGPLLALLVILKTLDIAFFQAFARPFDLIGDAGDAGIGVETLRGALGHTTANLIVIGVVTLAVTLVVVMTLATFRLTRVVAEHPRGSLAAVGGLGAVWMLCTLVGAQLLPNAPVASTATAGYLVHEVQSVQADIRDEGVFANQIRHDAFRHTPGSRLLTGLRGKDVLLVFVESYGRVSVEGSSFAPAIDSLLNHGTQQLQRAGFSARSAFVDAPGFGGLSWLAHSTLQSGVWANSQRRYDQLVATDRFTLSDAFNRAGWRTINFAPADDRSWPEGASFYHYDKLYDRRDMGYRGPGFNYAPMPDQYMFAALRRLELGTAHRRPLFAEVDTVSSHMPWDRIPQMLPWNDLGDGSVFRHVPEFRKPSSFWWHPNQVKTAYARSLEYSLNTLISFVRRYGKKNLVLVVVGDEQPLAIVSGQHAGHDVPISVIARDRSVLKRISHWGWQAGLLPSRQAPVWRMSAFRDRFLTAYGPQPANRS